MNTKYKLDENGYRVINFIGTSKKICQPPEVPVTTDEGCDDIECSDVEGSDVEGSDVEGYDEEIEIETFEVSPNIEVEAKKSSPLLNHVEEEDLMSMTPPYNFYAKIRCLSDVQEEDEYDDGPSTNICYQTVIQSTPIPTLADLKLSFTKVMGRNVPLKNIKIYKIFYPNIQDPELKNDGTEIQLADGRRGVLLFPDSKTIEECNIVNGDFFEVEFP